MQYAICNVAAAPVRKEAAHRSEMTNQLIFGDIILIMEEHNEWFKIKSLYDGYEGWITYHLFDVVDETLATMPLHFVCTDIINPVLPAQPIYAPMGASLTGYNEETHKLWNKKYTYYGAYRNVEQPFTADLLWNIVLAWMNAPYLWGGRTFMGVDCSGFVQIAFKVLGIPLLRDAYQQATQGKPVKTLPEATAGNVAFFENEKGRIIHVGILLNNHQIVHASGKVRIDKVDEQGIVHMETGSLTHKLACIRKFF